MKTIALLCVLSSCFAPAFAVAAPPEQLQRALESAVAGEVLVNIALECGWVSGDAEFKTARNASLQVAVLELDVMSRYLVAAKLFGNHPNWMQFAVDEAKTQVAQKDACTQDKTRGLWETLRAIPPPLGAPPIVEDEVLPEGA